MLVPSCWIPGVLGCWVLEVPGIFSFARPFEGVPRVAAPPSTPTPQNPYKDLSLSTHTLVWPDSVWTQGVETLEMGAWWVGLLGFSMPQSWSLCYQLLTKSSGLRAGS